MHCHHKNVVIRLQVAYLAPISYTLMNWPVLSLSIKSLSYTTISVQLALNASFNRYQSNGSNKGFKVYPVHVLPTFIFICKQFNVCSHVTYLLVITSSHFCERIIFNGWVAICRRAICRLVICRIKCADLQFADKKYF